MQKIFMKSKRKVHKNMKKTLAVLLIFSFCLPSVVMANCLPVYKKAEKSTDVKFASADFGNSFKEKDLYKIRFSILPMEYQGKLLFKGKEVKELQEIPLDKIDKLKFVPNKNFTGSVVFLWNGAEKGEAFCESPSTVTLFLEKNSSETPAEKKGFFDKIKELFKI